MNKVFSFKIIYILLFVFILVIGHSYFLFNTLKIKQRTAYIGMQYNLKIKNIGPEHQLKILNSNRSKLNWKNYHEFYFNNFICDIVSETIIGDSLLIKFVYDKKETSIEKQITEFYKEVNSSNNKNKKKHKTSLKQLVYLNESKIDLCIFFIFKEIRYILFHFKESRYYKEIHIPPSNII